MGTLHIEKVETILLFLDRYSFTVRIVLQNKLLQIQESALMRYLLANLHGCTPHVFGRETSAIGTLAILYNDFNFKCTL